MAAVALLYTLLAAAQQVEGRDCTKSDVFENEGDYTTATIPQDSTFALLDNDGWTASSATDAGGAGAGGVEVDTKYGSVHRANMRQSALGVPSTGAAADDNGAAAHRGIELVSVYNAAEDFERCKECPLAEGVPIVIAVPR
eukprot:gene14722-651_t